ncbi:MAG: hypothetical protein OSA98_13415 [Rubripirellula sp.]|nr:hypothetical protein [Rubripirellula sp.]
MNFVLQPWQLFLLILANWSNREQQQRVDYLESQCAVLMEQFGNPPPTVQAKGRNPETQKKPMREKPANNWVCLSSALGDLVTKLPEPNALRNKSRFELSL